MMRSQLLGLGGLVAVVLLSGTSGGTEDTIPRYRLQPGRVLTYRGVDKLDLGKSAIVAESERRATVIRVNDDGSWRVVVCSSTQRRKVVAGKSRPLGERIVSAASCDLFPDGRLVETESFVGREGPSSLFPRLPADAAQARVGWDSNDPVQDARTAFRPLAAAGGTWNFEGLATNARDRVRMATSRTRYEFDLARGLLHMGQCKYSEAEEGVHHGTDAIELVSVEVADPASLQVYAEQSDRFFAANQAYQAALGVSLTARDAAARLARAESDLKAAREAITLSDFRNQVDSLLRQHAKIAGPFARSASEIAELIGRPSPEWEARGLDGKVHAIRDYRGKVVVLDFWSRNCGWCLRAMPQMKQMAEDFRDRPVAILGMSTDHAEEDTRFVAETMKLNYPTLRAEEIPEMYHITGFPTLVVIGPDGKVADIHVGYSPKLREEVGQIIEGLLAGK